MVSFEGFRAVDGVPIYLQIQTYIRRGCVAGTIRDGDAPCEEKDERRRC